MPSATSEIPSPAFRHRLRFTALPSPTDLSEYERLVPGTAERILKLAERSAENRDQLERELVRVRERVERTRLILFCLALFAVVFNILFVGVLAANHRLSLTTVWLPTVVASVSGFLSGYFGSMFRGRVSPRAVDAGTKP